MCSVVEGWEERAGRNEALFREVNENIAQLEERMGFGVESLPVICECSRPDCTTQLRISLDQYTRVRRHPHRFIVAPGHEQPSLERVVDECAGYVIVEKEGSAAMATDAVS